MAVQNEAEAAAPELDVVDSLGSALLPLAALVSRVWASNQSVVNLVTLEYRETVGGQV